MQTPLIGPKPAGGEFSEPTPEKELIGVDITSDLSTPEEQPNEVATSQKLFSHIVYESRGYQSRNFSYESPVTTILSRYCLFQSAETDRVG